MAYCKLAKICLFHQGLQAVPDSPEQQKGCLDEAEQIPPDTLAIVALLLASKRASGRREVYVKSLDHYTTRFAKQFPRLDLVTCKEVESFLSQFSGHTRSTWLNRINTMFAFAFKREIISKNPCAAIERVMIERKSPQILTAKQSREVLQLAPTLCRAGVILCMYAGIRPDEVHKLTWDDICLKSKTVRVSHTKTRVPRIVPLEEIAVKLLGEVAIKKGPVCPSHSTMRRFKRRARAFIGSWAADTLRHTAASFLLAKYKDAGKVATMLGNSSAVMLKHYHTPVTEEECERFWAL